MTTSHSPHNPSFDADEMRFELNEQRISEFLGTLINENDPSSQLQNLTSLASKCLEQMLDTERQMMKDFITDSTDGLCPGCLIMHTRDVTQLENTIEQFNNYVSENGQCNA